MNIDVTETRRPSRNVRRKAETRAKLLSAARIVVAEKGVEPVTIKEITEAADVGFGSFYNHFESKETLLNECVRETSNQIAEAIDVFTASFENPIDVIATAFNLFDKIAKIDPIMAWFTVRVTEHRTEWTESLMSSFVRDVKRGIEMGKFHVPDVPLATHLAAGSFVIFARERMQGRVTDEGVVHFVHMTLRLLGVDEETALEAAQRAWKRVNP